MFTNLDEGGLTTYRTAIVQNQHLAILAKVELDSYCSSLNYIIVSLIEVEIVSPRRIASVPGARKTMIFNNDIQFHIYNQPMYTIFGLCALSTFTCCVAVSPSFSLLLFAFLGLWKERGSLQFSVLCKTASSTK